MSHPLGRGSGQGPKGRGIEEWPGLHAHLGAPGPDSRHQCLVSGHHAEPRPHGPVLVEACAHEIHAELQRARLIEQRRAHPRATGVVDIHDNAPGVCQLHDLPDVLHGEDLVGHGQPGHGHQAHARLVLESLAKALEPPHVDQLGAGLRDGAHHGGVAVAGGDADHHVAGLHEGQVGGVRGPGQAVEERRVMPVGGAAEVIERGLAELVEVERGGHEIVGDGEVAGLQGQPVLEAVEVEDGGRSARFHPVPGVPPGLLELPEIVLGAWRMRPRA